MILFPAIDLKDGQCVRLKLGDMAQATIYNDDPAAQALAFEQQGFSWLHVVDLNGAFAGQSVNGAAVEAILKTTKNPVQLGGGIRTLAHIEHWLSKGLARVILGTIAVRDPALVKEIPDPFFSKMISYIDENLDDETFTSEKLCEKFADLSIKNCAEFFKTLTEKCAK